MTWTAGRRDEALLRQLQKKHPDRLILTPMFPKLVRVPREKKRLAWRKGRIRRVSKKRGKQLRRYTEFRRYIAKVDGGCVACLNGWNWCGPRAYLEPFEIDHVDGRRGDMLLDPGNAVQLHRSGHQFKTDHAREARKLLRAYTWARRMKMVSFGGLDTGSVPGVPVGHPTKEGTPNGEAGDQGSTPEDPPDPQGRPDAPRPGGNPPRQGPPGESPPTD